MTLEGLAASAREHLALLRAVHLCERDLYNAGPDLSQAIAVYLATWLPKLNNHIPSNTLQPPSLDVAWVWQLHKSDPSSYQSDCVRWYGRILDVPTGMSPFSHSSSLSSWNEVPSETCPGVDGDLAERIASSAMNRSSFFWHVNWPEYYDAAFLEESVNRYVMMLRLMNDHPKQFIVPTYDIDNIWHTHLAFPCRYIEDCRRLARREINHHDDAGLDRSSGGFLSTSTLETEQLWNATYDSTWRKAGGMHRGEPPCWFWSDRQRAAAPFNTELPSPAPSLNSLTRYAVHVIGRAFGTAVSTEVCALLNFLFFFF
jgi:hypothetical protein